MTDRAPFPPEKKPQKLLPGTPDATVLLPLDGAPAIELTPRWGYSRPLHPALEQLFASNVPSYLEVVRGLRDLAGNPRSTIGQGPQGVLSFTDHEINGLDLMLISYMLCRYRPANYIEIGSGTSTHMVAKTIADHQLPTQLTCIDPAPRKSLDGLTLLHHACGLEAVTDLTIFAALVPGDIVFFDGTHRSFQNSDVTVFFLDILPQLQPGVLVHLHDIALPFDYDEYFKLRYWNEQYLLATYLLAAPDRIEVLFPSYFCCHAPGVREHLDPPILRGINRRYSQLGGRSGLQSVRRFIRAELHIPIRALQIRDLLSMRSEIETEQHDSFWVRA